MKKKVHTQSTGKSAKAGVSLWFKSIKGVRKITAKPSLTFRNRKREAQDKAEWGEDNF